MSTTLHITASREFGNRRPGVQAQIDELQCRLDELSDDEIEAFLTGISRALDTAPEQSVPAELATFRDPIAEAQRVEDEVESLMRSFERRRELLAGALTAPQVARLLNTTRQTPHDRVKAGTLLALMDRGALRFPAWQFDPEGPDGVIAGLPDVIQALDVSPLAKISWLTRPQQAFDGQASLDLLRQGQVERVVRQARGTGVA